MNGRLWIVSAAFCLVGCVHQRTIAPDVPPAAVAELNRQIAPYAGTAVMQNHERYRGRFAVAFDSTAITDSTGLRRVLPNVDIARIMVADRARGRREGLTYGAFTGAALGGIVGISIAHFFNNSVMDDPRKMSLPGTLAMGAGIGAVPGGLLGLMIGTDFGAVIKIRFASHIPSGEQWHGELR